MLPTARAKASDPQGLAVMMIVTVVDERDGGVGALSELLRKRAEEMVVPVELPDGSEAARTAAAMSALEKPLGELAPAAVLVQGDAPVAPAAALVAVKLGIPTIRLGAGVRTGERHAAAEINRVVADRACDLLLCADEGAMEHLRREGLDRAARLVGDPEADPEPAAREILGWLGSRTAIPGGTGS
jgi:UDP-N-acetylglucosamine 2-epimerase